LLGIFDSIVASITRGGSKSMFHMTAPHSLKLGLDNTWMRAAAAVFRVTRD